MSCKRPSRSEKDAKARSDKIDRQLMTEARKTKKEIKMLLLESGNAGGAELLRQLKLIYQGYTASEREAYKEVIFSNAIQAMRSILEALPDLGLTLSPDNDASSAIILSHPSHPNQAEYKILPRDIADAIHTLWHDPAIQAVIRRSNEFDMNDSAIYYFSTIDRLALPGYLPTDQDILRCRFETTGISETSFVVGDVMYKFFYPGAQRGERKKWIHQFENVTAVVFAVNLADYDEMPCDKSTTHLQEAISDFDSICNSKWLSQTSFILLFNHTDHFADKLPHTPLGDYFRGGNDSDAALDYLLHRFVSLNQSSAQRQIYIHYYCSNDPQKVGSILSSIQDILLQLDLRRRRLL
ncbi:heterotrimeric G protein alpha subunit B [Gymnopilus junonius]|uniref:Heterotrimeric G protein alpha subunit B n=1 Tax=Gymnopilus junonius TaxID=109634 RepID=A0A9P5TP99_GYMJU|nr:heterotrimeric G protein alpha subunit B [Gymnopilus junonius]